MHLSSLQTRVARLTDEHFTAVAFNLEPPIAKPYFFFFFFFFFFNVKMAVMRPRLVRTISAFSTVNNPSYR